MHLTTSLLLIRDCHLSCSDLPLVTHFHSFRLTLLSNFPFFNLLPSFLPSFRSFVRSFLPSFLPSFRFFLLSFFSSFVPLPSFFFSSFVPLLSCPTFQLFPSPTKVNMGNALREDSRLDEALHCYRTALQLKPDHPHGWNNLANALKDKGTVHLVRNLNFLLSCHAIY